jgi:phage gp46-like protein
MDLELVETLNGGDLVRKGKDVSVINGFQNMIYLGLFGGNVEASTPLVRNENEQDFSWWGNNLFFRNDASVQMNSLTERALKDISLTSFGRRLIENAVKKDLEFMKPFANISVVVNIIATDRVMIGVKSVRLDNLAQRVFVYIWDKTILELSEADAALSKGGEVVNVKIFDSSFDFAFE